MMRAWVVVGSGEHGCNRRGELDVRTDAIDANRVDQAKFARGPVRNAGQFCNIIDNFDPIAGLKAKRLIPAQTHHVKPAGSISGTIVVVDDVIDRGHDRAVVPGKLKRGASWQGGRERQRGRNRRRLTRLSEFRPGRTDFPCRCSRLNR